jgi:hypothetical protein
MLRSFSHICDFLAKGARQVEPLGKGDIALDQGGEPEVLMPASWCEDVVNCEDVGEGEVDLADRRLESDTVGFVLEVLHGQRLPQKVSTQASP